MPEIRELIKLTYRIKIIVNEYDIVRGYACFTCDYLTNEIASSEAVKYQIMA